MRTAAIVGTGLIGTSVALALRAGGTATHLIDIDPVAARTAEALGAGTTEKPPDVVDIAVLAVPPTQVAPVLASLQKQGVARVYTDVASVKSLPRREAEALGCDLTSVVGGHPLAGGERSGPLIARADLFEGRPWVLVPSEPTSTLALNCALELVALCGATPVLLDAETHDRAVAVVSHAPHLICSLAAARLLDVDESVLRLAGQGLRDVTRIAGGSPSLWADILAANAGLVAAVLDSFAADVLEAADGLRQLAHGCDEGPDRVRGGARLIESLQRGADGRSTIPGKYGMRETAFSAVEVAVGDSPGELARLFADVAAVGCNIEDVDIEHSTDQRAGRVRVFVVRNRVHDLAAQLRLRNWVVQGS
ncbi:prephenate dehydrogenase [Streptomyces sp. NBC_01142]|uniref:prephenate dehydrogenase n=1 Tax=Streptomyces sp. NBC_01142 TaxID=2975865 RepID=UPI00224CA124|nr:prephenate dehydrogenase [Streptomyces sp. NBC_01142]MCX4820177.1 prephenate dehydrogenase [Streptomyces sp. NBC_01142]